MRIDFVANTTKAGAGGVLRRLAEHARGLGLRVGGGKPEALVVLGGDGTMLSAVKSHPGVPLLGFNLGTLGYLSAVEEPGFEEALRALAEGRYAISERTALEVRGTLALNDVVVQRGVSGQAASLAVSVDGHSAARFMADGIVVATPTGSTAYSLAAGGPILMPDSQSLAVTPVCPHALSARPLVVRDAAKLEVAHAPRPGAGPLEVFADGVKVAELAAGETLEVRKAERGVPLVELEGHDPYEVLARKLGYPGDMQGRRDERT